MHTNQVVAFTGGGSAGHVFPALAVAEYLQNQASVKVVWIGSKGGIESTLVSQAGIAYHALPSGKLRRYLSWKNIRDIFLVMAGILAALILLRKMRPALLFSKGGYVSVPVVIAAALLRIRIISHESDLVPGLATRINLRFSHRLLLSFDKSYQYIARRSREKCQVTGNPLRWLIHQADALEGRKIIGASAQQKMVLFLGGSLGAAQINTLIIEAIAMMPKNWLIVHQRGALSTLREKNGASVPCPAQERHRYRGHEFFGEEIGHLIAAADVIVSRAGANTLWELARLGKVMLLIPLPRSSSRGDQIDNAAYFVERRAARLLEEPTAPQIVEEIKQLMDNRATRKTLSANAQAIAPKDATIRVAAHILAALKER